MENSILRKEFQIAQETIIGKLKADPKCLAGFLVGSMSHDLIWEWSDLEILVIYDDSYNGPPSYYLLENDIHIHLNIIKRSTFKDYLNSTNVSDYWFCALSKSTLLFSKDITINDLFEDLFFIGDRDREIEMLLGFSEAIYYLNKVEKNLKIKGNKENALYFLFHLAQGIAWVEVARERVFPEREIIAQARNYKPNLFKEIYDPLFNGPITEKEIEIIIDRSHQYLNENTLEIYRPIIDYLKENKTLKDFSLKTREHGFGINFDWLYRRGIVDIYVEPLRINNRPEEFYKIGYRIKE